LINLVSLLLLTGCPGNKDSAEEANVFLEDPQNYTFVGELAPPAIEVKSQSDLTIDWSGLVDDVQCHDVDPASITRVSLLRFQNLTQEETTDKINNDALQQADLTNYVDYENVDQRDVAISEMTFFGTDVNVSEYITEDGGTYLLILGTGEEIGTGIRALTYLTPLDSSSNTTVIVPEPCGLLDYTVDLSSLTTLSVGLEGPYILDWSALTADGRGKIFDDSAVDQVLVGHYNTLGASDLEANFLDLELLADELWTLPVANVTQANLSDISDFTGFTADGTWILALRCTSCANPAPLFLTIVQAQ